MFLDGSLDEFARLADDGRAVRVGDNIWKFFRWPVADRLTDFLARDAEVRADGQFSQAGIKQARVRAAAPLQVCGDRFAGGLGFFPSHERPGFRGEGDAFG